MTRIPLSLEAGSVAVIGLPTDAFSSFMSGAAKGPGQIRRVWHSGAHNGCAENGIDIEDHPLMIDLGDLDLEDVTGALDLIGDSFARLAAQGVRPIALGGDHAVTYPIIQALGPAYPDLTILHLDAHPDLYDRFDDSRTSHACPFARIMEERLATRLVQVGIRAANGHQRDQARRFAVEQIPWSQLDSDWIGDLKGPLYLSVDMDAFDPAFAPGVAHHEPGGLAPRQVIEWIQRLGAPLVGADIVETNPDRDPIGVTAALAFKLLKEIAARMLAEQGKKRETK